MKKIYILFAAVITLLANSAFGQNVLNYQLPYFEFNQWYNTTPNLPSYWYSYSSIQCTFDATLCAMAETNGIFNDHHKKVRGYTGGGSDWAIQLYTVQKMGKNINGALTTGKIALNSDDFSSTENYVYTQRNGSCNWPFAGRPDSLSLRARFSFKQNTYPKASARIHIHGDVDYEDLYVGSFSDPRPGKIANLNAEIQNPATTPNSNGVYQSGWTRFAYKFNYWDANNNLIDTPTLSNTAQPHYLLASLSTNKNLGVGAEDSVALDQITCIYDKGLASLTINGVEQDSIRELFNIKEYAKHDRGTGNNGGQYSIYDYHLYCYTPGGNDLPYVTAKPKSGLVTSCVVTQPNLNNPNTIQATIVVTHNDNSTFTYYLVFRNLKPSSPLTLSHPDNTYTSCIDNPAVVTVSGAETYVWSTGETGASIQPTTSDTYYVTGTNSVGCQSKATAYVTVHPLPNATITGSTSACFGKTCTLTAGGGSRFAWSTGDTTTSISVPTGTIDTYSYTVTVTSSAGCSATADTTVTVHPLPDVTITGDHYLCSGNSTTLHASGTATTYQWNNGTIGNDLTIYSGGNYSVTGTNSYGCTASSSHSVNSKPTPTVNITGPDVLCAGTTATLNATSNLGTAFTWSTQETGPSITISAPGTYSVSTTYDGCSNSTSYQIEEVSRPAAPIASSVSRCGSGPITLTATPATGCTCLWYASESSTSILSTENSLTINNLAESHTYYVSAQNGSGCISNRTPVTATINALPAPPTVSNASYCGEGDYTLHASSTNPVQWYSDNAGTSPIDSNRHITQSTTFYVAAIDGNGCRSQIKSSTITIHTIPGLPTVTQPDPVCSNNNISVTLTATPGSNGTGIKWYNSEMNNVGHENSYKANNISTANTTYYASTTNANCESEKVTVYIVKNPIPSAPSLSCNPRCGAGEVTLQGSANGLTIMWYDANDNYLGEGQTYTTNISGNTTFKAKAFNGSTGCISSAASITAIMHPNRQTEFSISQCNSYSWNNETFTQSGDYTRHMSTIHGCDSAVTLHLTINSSDATSFDTTVCNSFNWRGHTYTTSQTIVETFTNKNNCDSVVTCHLNVLKSTTFADTLVLCSNQLPYEYANTQITGEGLKTITLTNVAGCDSVISLKVIVNPQPNLPNVTDLSICGAGQVTLNASPNLNGTTCRWYSSPEATEFITTDKSFKTTVSETTTYYVSSYNGTTQCESGRLPITVTVNAVPSMPQVADVARCGQGEVTFNATIDNNATTCRWFLNNVSTTPADTGLSFTRTVSASSTPYFVESYNGVTGCKSSRKTVVATVNAIPAVPQFSSVSNCGSLTADLSSYITSGNSDLYRWYDQNNNLLTQNAHYSPTITVNTTFLVSGYNDQTGCESEKNTLTVTIYPTYNPQDLYDTVCQYTHYQAHNIDQTFNDTGDFPFVLAEKSSNQCDSLVTLHIHVKPQITKSITAEACEKYVWNDSLYTKSGNYTQTFLAANGCDSIVTLQLTIHPAVSSQFSATACTSYQWNDSIYDKSGDYIQHFSNIHGCDSSVTLHLTIHNISTHEFSATACTSYTWNESVYYASGDYVQQFKNIHGCDSTVTLHLTIHSTSTSQFSAAECVSYQWNDSIYYKSGDYIQQFKNIHGCDSTVTLHLTIYSPDQVVLTDQVCAGTRYTNYGFDTVITQTGLHTLIHNGHNIHDCDSTTTLQLSVNPVLNTVLDRSICFNKTYTFHDRVLNTAGTYVDTLQSVHGCDSIITLNLTVYSEKRDTLYAEICHGESYQLHGFEIMQPDTSGTHLLVTNDKNGCDSTTVLYLTVNMPATTDIYAERCLGEPYNENGFNILPLEAENIERVQHLETSHGCDSTVTLHLTVHPLLSTTLTDTVCSGERYTRYGFDTVFAQAKNYILTQDLHTIHGCDSIVTLTLTVNPVLRTTLDESICFNGSYTFNNKTITTAGTYVDTLSAVTGCDSIITLHLNVYPERRDTITAAVCLGEPYQLNGFNIEHATATGYHSISDSDVHNCDSTTVLYLIVNQPANTKITDAICLGESYTENGFNLTPEAAGTVTDTLHLQTAHGCDSTVVLTLTVNPVFHTTLNAYICFDSSYNFNGKILTASGVYYDTLKTVNGCDSTFTLNLTVFPEKRDTLTDAICFGKSYQLHGFNLPEVTATGYHSITNPDVHGCDSTTVLYLVVNQPAATAVTGSICLGDSYTENGFNLTPAAAGIVTDTLRLQTAHGCDSIVSLTLTVRPTSTYEFSDTACVFYIWNDSTYYQSGDYIQQFKNVNDCDSTVTLHLTIHATSTSQFSFIACDSYQWNDSIYYQTGDYIQQFKNVNGCDSTVTLHLTINYTSTSQFSVTACDNYQWNDSIYYQTGDYIQRFKNISGCDSIVTLHLTINHTSTSQFSATACDSYQWNDSIYYQTGDYTQVFKNINGCDSTVTLHLTINPTATYAFWDTACVSYTWANTTYTQSGNYTKHFETVHGCDSAVTLHLTIHNPDQIAFYEHMCANDHYVGHGFDTTISQSGIFTLTHQDVNMYGCDSTTTLQLTVHELDTTHIYASICKGESYTENGFTDIETSTLEPGEHEFYRYENVSYGCEYTLILHLTVNPLPTITLFDTVCAGTPYSAYGFDTIATVSGNYTLKHVNPSIHSCDSTTTLHLTVHPVYHITLNDSICFNEFYTFHSRTLNVTGTYVDTLTTIDGCDSIITLNLHVYPEKRDTIYDEICLGESYYKNGFEIIQPSVSGYHPLVVKDVNGCDSTTILYLTVNSPANTDLYAERCQGVSYEENGFNIPTPESGEFNHQLKLKTVHNCDSTVTLHLTVHPVKSIQLTDTVCAGARYIAHGFDTIITTAGTHTLSHVNPSIHGCDSTTTLQLTVHPIFDTTLNESICSDDSYLFNGTSITTSGTYVDTLPTVNGCDSIIRLNLTVYPVYNDTLYGDICLGESYTENGFNITPETAGTFEETHYLETIHNCDSNVTLMLNVRPTSTYEFWDTACVSYTWNHETYQQGGDYVQHFTNVSNCDSTVTLHLTIYDPDQVSFSDQICANEPYSNHGFDTTITEAGTHTLIHQGQNIHGCDSTTTLQLTIHPVFHTTLNKNICYNDSYNFNGRILTESGTYFDTLQTVHGCDSTFLLNLTVFDEKRDTIYDEICYGKPYQKYGFNIENPTVSDTFTRVKKDKNGCDSTTVLYLTVNEPVVTEIYAERCQGEGYNENNFNIKTLNIGTFIYQKDEFTSHGCDSTVILYLTVNPIKNIVLEDTICAGTHYTSYGFDTVFTQAKKYTLNHKEQTSHGCDSTFTLQLTVNPVKYTTLTESICFNKTYDFHGAILSTAGTYVDTLQTVNGCDSVVTLKLSKYPENVRYITAHICKGDSYNENGFHIETPTVTDTYQHTDFDVNGCDSTTILELMVHELDTTHITASICAGDTYAENGFNIPTSEPGEFEEIRSESAAFGCEYTLVLHLTVNPVPVISLTDTICAGSPYSNYGFDTIITQAGSYTLTHHNPSIYNCDSTTTLKLTVFPAFDTVINESICFNEKYYFKDDSLNVSGTYIDTLQTIKGCDSIITLNLTVYPERRDTIVAHICQGDSYNNYNFSITTPSESGIHSHVNKDIHGCDSTTVLQLYVHNLDTTHFQASVCQGDIYVGNGFEEPAIEPGDFEYVRTDSTEYGCQYTYILHLHVRSTHTESFADTNCVSYLWNDSIFTESGDYTMTFTNTENCDSTVTLHLTIHQAYNESFTIDTCDSYLWNDSLYTVSGEYVQHFHSIHGCDSTMTLLLTINSSFETDTTVNTCDYLVPFNWDDNAMYSFYESGDHDIVFTTVAGCDSIIHLHLNVNTSYEQDTTVTTCQGALPYVFADSSFNNSGDFVIRLTSESGCDSIWNLHLTVTPNTEHEHSHTICNNELPYSYMDSIFTEAGQYDIVVPDENNCLDITHFTLIVNDTTHGYDTVTVCEENLPYFYGTTELTQTGDYDIHYNAVNSCDSLITVHFTVIPTAHGVKEMYVCEGDFPITFDGTTFDSAGVYNVTYHRDGLCDSIVTLTLHEASKYLITEIDSICDHELPYSWRNMEFTQTGVYYDSSLVSIHGCDSVYRLLLTVNETQVIVSDSIVLCYGESETWRGMTLSESGTYRDTVASATTGCREIHEITVTVHPTYHYYDTVTICDNELPYPWRDRTFYEAGTDSIILQTVGYGCDSIYRITLFVNPTAHHDESVNVCDYDLPYLWHGQSLTESGIYYDTMTTTAGCDSTFTLNFTVYSSSHIVIDTTVCNTQLPIVWRGYPLSAAGTYFDTVPNTYGCNDVYEMHLSVNQSNTTTIYDTICQGGHYTLNGFDTLATQSGTLYDQRTLTNASGCDSIVNLILNVLPSYLFEVSAETCDNVPFQWHGGEFLIAGDYYDSLTTVNGCDSVYILHLSLNPTYEVYVSDSAMANHEYQYDNLVVTPSDSGTFQYDIQYYTIAHCDSVIHLTLSVAFNDGIDDYVTPEFSFFPNPTQAALNITGERMKRIHVYDLSGKLVLIADPDTPEQARIYVNGFATGHYVVRVTLDDGKTVTGKIIVNRR